MSKLKWRKTLEVWYSNDYFRRRTLSHHKVMVMYCTSLVMFKSAWAKKGSGIQTLRILFHSSPPESRLLESYVQIPWPLPLSTRHTPLTEAVTSSHFRTTVRALPEALRTWFLRDVRRISSCWKTEWSALITINSLDDLVGRKMHVEKG